MFALCVEASHERGMGHLFRALALANALEARGGASIVYVNADRVAEAALRRAGRPWKTVPLHAEADWEAERIRADAIRVWVDDWFETSVSHARRVKAAGVRLATLNDRGGG